MKGKHYCCAFGCLNNNKKHPDISFFTLPKDIDRRRKWLKLIDREDLLQKADLKKSSYLVCSAHFDDSSVKIIKKVKENALPSLNLHSQPEEGSSCSVTSKVIVLSNKVIEAGSTDPEVQITSTLIKYKPQLILDAVPTKLPQIQPSTSNQNANEECKDVSTQTNVSIIEVLSAEGPDEEASCVRTTSDLDIIDHNTSQTAQALSSTTTRRKIWLEIIGRTDLLTTKTKAYCHIVCSLHFNKSMIKYKPYLLPDAVPTRLPQNQPKTSKHNEDCNNVSTQTEDSIISILSAVQVPDKEVSCVQITSENPRPYRPGRCREWLSLIGREDLLNKKILKPNSYQVCEVHFENSEIEIIKKLKVNAVPTRNFYNESHTGSPTTSKEPKASNVCSQTKSNIDTITNIKKPDTISKGTQTETYVNIIDSDEKSQTARYLSQKTPRKGNLLQKLSDSELKRKRLEAPDRPDLTTEESTCSTPFKPDVISTSQLRRLLESEIKKDAIHTRPFPRQPDIGKFNKEDVTPTSLKSGAREPDIEEDHEDIVPNNKSTQTDESFITIIVPPTTIKSEIIEKNSVSVQTDSEHKPTCSCHHIKTEPVDADDTAAQVSRKTVYSVYVQTDQELYAVDASGSDKAADQELNVADISGPDLPSNTQGKLTHSGLQDSDQGTVPSSSSQRKRKLENPHRSDKKKGVKLKKLF